MGQLPTPGAVVACDQSVYANVALNCDGAGHGVQKAPNR